MPRSATASRLNDANRTPGGQVVHTRESGAYFPIICFVILLLGSCGCARDHEVVVAEKRPDNVEAAIFAADGAGDFRVCSLMLRKVAREEHASLHIIHCPWSHGYGRIIADQVGSANMRSKGVQLAGLVEEYHRNFPEVPIHLFGHSAGTGVILAALENLPPDIVDRAILLSPSVPSHYDVRPALCRVKHGLHVYYSRHDWFYLGVATCLLGGRRCTNSSGRVGFRLLGDCVEDQAYYVKLYQRAWQVGDQATGNFGGHYGNYQPEFLRRQILPLLRSPRASPTASQAGATAKS